MRKNEEARVSIRDYYMETYPTDELGPELKDITFADFFGGLVMRQDIYNWMGVADSLIRERLFSKLADILEKDYDHVYDLWLSA